jgi:hypothetical protein
MTAINQRQTLSRDSAQIWGLCAAAFVIAVALMATRRLLVVAAAGLLMAGTIVGFIVVRTHGLFGFKLPFTSGEAWAVLVIEVAGVILTAVICWLMTRPQST